MCARRIRMQHSKYISIAPAGRSIVQQLPVDALHRNHGHSGRREFQLRVFRSGDTSCWTHCHATQHTDQLPVERLPVVRCVRRDRTRLLVCHVVHFIAQLIKRLRATHQPFHFWCDFIFKLFDSEYPDHHYHRYVGFHTIRGTRCAGCSFNRS